MKSQFEIKKKKLIDEILAKAEYGTLAICEKNKPYSVPINYAYVDGLFYFHGAKKGKKIAFMQNNALASFSVVEVYSIIQSYFSNTEGLACPASHFFKSISVDGKIVFVDEYDEKVFALGSLMKQLQPEGRYKPLDDEEYTKMINATEVFKLVPSEIRGKIKLGQHLPQKRYEMILEYLEKRGSKIDRMTVQEMRRHQNSI